MAWIQGKWVVGKEVEIAITHSSSVILLEGDSSVYKLAMKIPLSSTELVAVTSTRTVKWLLLRSSSLQIYYFNEAKLLNFSQI